MDWNNIDFNSSYERGQDFLSGYNFETVILEVLCNMRTEDINPNSVMQHINKVINNKKHIQFPFFYEMALIQGHILI